jgi:hypothetical protein
VGAVDTRNILEQTSDNHHLMALMVVISQLTQPTSERSKLLRKAITQSPVVSHGNFHLASVIKTQFMKFYTKTQTRVSRLFILFLSSSRVANMEI